MLYLRSFNRFILISLALLGLSVSSVNASIVADANTGLVSPDVVVDFGNGLYPPSTVTVISNQFSAFGVTFGQGPMYLDCNCVTAALNQGYLNGSNSNGGSPFDIFFATRATDAVFSFLTNSGTSTFTSFLNGFQQESFQAATDAATPIGDGRYYGFVNSLFDHILVTPGGTNSAYNLDNLQINFVPVPAAVWLFGTALIGLVGFGRRSKLT